MYFVTSKLYAAYRFIKLDLTARASLTRLFDTEGFDVVINLAAQAGVRHSIEDPYAYIESNVDRFSQLIGELSPSSGQALGVCQFE